ncbi:MAG: DUF2098 domain-containing protein [Methanoregulaceae archaeon]|nr:DUF2098 domain-containing protein [Methanoregulaceae archaeon]
MQSGEIAVGMQVRYERTGTTGKVMRIAKEEGECFAELDSTHLLYRIDQLVPTGSLARKAVHDEKREDQKKQLEKERSFASSGEFAESVKNIDQSCEGGG